MKKVSLFLVALFATIYVSAQVEGGNIVLMGGGGFFTNTNTSETPNNKFESKFNQGFLDFGGMYMFTNNIGAGLALQLNNTTNFSDGDKTSSSSVFGAVVMGRYYSPCMAPRFYTFGQVDFGFGSGSRKSFDEDGNEIESQRDNISQLSFGIRPGIAYFLTPAIMLEASFGALAWQQQRLTNNENNDFRDQQTSLEFFAFSKTLSFGFCWWLGRGGASFN